KPLLQSMCTKVTAGAGLVAPGPAAQVTPEWVYALNLLSELVMPTAACADTVRVKPLEQLTVTYCVPDAKVGAANAVSDAASSEPASSTRARNLTRHTSWSLRRALFTAEARRL